MRFPQKNVNIMEEWRPQRAYLWEVRLPFVDGVGSSDSVSKKVLGVRFGFKSMGAQREQRTGTGVSKYPGLESIDTVTLTLVETEDVEVLSYFTAWKKMIVDDSGYNMRSVYAKDITCKLLKSDRTESVKFKFLRSYPSKIMSYDLKYTNSEAVQYEIVLSVDDVTASVGGIVSRFIPDSIMNLLPPSIAALADVTNQSYKSAQSFQRTVLDTRAAIYR